MCGQIIIYGLLIFAAELSAVNSRTNKAVISEVISPSADYAIHMIGIALSNDEMPIVYFYKSDGSVIGGVKLTLFP